MSIGKLNIRLIADTNIQNLASYLLSLQSKVAFQISNTSYNQVRKQLYEIIENKGETKSDATFLWIHPHITLQSFNQLANYADWNEEQIIQETKSLAKLVIEAANNQNFLITTNFVYPYVENTFNLTKFKGDFPINTVLHKINNVWVNTLLEKDNIYILDVNQWLINVDAKAFQPKLWYYSKTLYHHQVFELAAQSIISAIEGIYQQGRKLLIVDLDNTLWGGILGDDGLENIRIGGHDAVGEAFADVQRIIKHWKNLGVVLAISSKNEEIIVKHAFENHPEMILKWDDFAVKQINWNDKAENIATILNTLNLTEDAAVFVDDQQAERERVQSAFPKMLIPNMPGDIMLIPQCLRELNCFNSPNISNEDREKHHLYIQETYRAESKKNFSSYDEWLQSIEIKVTYEEVNTMNMERVVQLINKTNQMNLTTRRLSKIELQHWLAIENNKMYAFSYEDKFGKAGLIGIISFLIEDKTLQIVDFILSCRVFARKIEESMLHVVSKLAMSYPKEKLIAQYIPTEKNAPCLQFLNNSLFIKNGNTFIYELDKSYPIPDYIQLIQR